MLPLFMKLFTGNSQNNVDNIQFSFFVKERAGYFVRRTANVKQWIISEAVDSELKKPAKIAFMKE